MLWHPVEMLSEIDTKKNEQMSFDCIYEWFCDYECGSMWTKLVNKEKKITKFAYFGATVHIQQLTDSPFDVAIYANQL